MHAAYASGAGHVRRMRFAAGRRMMPDVGRNYSESGRVTLGDGVHIGDNVTLEGRITIGDGTRIDHGCVVRGDVEIGRGNWLYPHCVVGTGPQHRDHADSHPPRAGRITIGDHNTIREFATIHRPTIRPVTAIGSHCYIMAYPHIAHDCVICDHAILTTRVTLGGHVHIGEYANIGQGTQIHPFCRVGRYAMVGQGSSITKDVPPFALMNRQRFTKTNRIGMERNRIPREDMDAIHRYYESGICADPDAWYVREIEAFRRESKRDTFTPDF